MRAREFRETAGKASRARLVKPRPAAAPQTSGAMVRDRGFSARVDRVRTHTGPVQSESGPPARAETLLALQRRYGNRYFNRLVAAARNVEDVRRDHDSAEGPVSASTPAVVDDSLRRMIDAESGGGHRLDPGARVQLESAFGEDFSDVRVHTDATADHLSRAVAAEAFTTGTDIFFRSGTYEPLNTAGRKLLAHELTHVVQQRGAPAAGELRVTDPDDPSEREANVVAEEVARLPTGGPVAQRAAYEKELSTSRVRRVHRASVQKGWIQRNWDATGPVNHNPNRADFEGLRTPPEGAIRVVDLLQLIPQNEGNTFKPETRITRGFKFEWLNWHVHGHEPDTGAATGHAGARSWVVRIRDTTTGSWLLATSWAKENLVAQTVQAAVDWCTPREMRTEAAKRRSHIPLIIT